MGENVIEGVTSNRCFGCGICAGICPTEALEMRIDKHGFYKPVMTDNECTDCGLCLNVCPACSRPVAKNTKISKNDDVFGQYVGIYGGWARDEQLRKTGSAGGVARGLAYELLDRAKIDGLLTVAPGEHNPLDPQPRLYEKKEDVKHTPKSLYLPTEYSQVFRFLLKNAGRYLVIGLPCQIAGLRKAEHYLKAEVILVDLFCGRMVSRLLTEGYIKLFTREKSENLSIDYRNKAVGWYDFSISVMDQLNNTLIVRECYNESIFGYFMNRRCFAQESCFRCSYSYSGVSDITLGDFWKSEYSEEKAGVSLIVTRTERGERILRESEALELFPVGISDLHSAQSHLVRNYRHFHSKLYTPLRQKHRLLNKAVLNLYLLFGNLRVPYLICRIDSGIFDALTKILLLVRRLLRRR